MRSSANQLFKKKKKMINLFTMNRPQVQSPSVEQRDSPLSPSKIGRAKLNNTKSSIDMKALEASSYKLNTFFAEQKAKKMNIVKNTLVDYDLFDYDKEKIQTMLFRRVKTAKAKNNISLQMEEERARKNVYTDG
jgi:hypothetical protein